MNQLFKKLEVIDVEKLTDNSVILEFFISNVMKKKFNYFPGQFVTLEIDIEGKKYYRTYSICSQKHESNIKIAVKRVVGGLISNWINEKVEIGDHIKVSMPAGDFVAKKNYSIQKKYLYFAGGSGITPIFSLIGSKLNSEPNSIHYLVFCNTTQSQVMFKSQLLDLKNKFISRLVIFFIFSEENNEFDIQNGFISKNKIQLIFSSCISNVDLDKIFLCGPVGMQSIVLDCLKQLKINKSKIKTESFKSENNLKTKKIVTDEKSIDANPKDFKMIVKVNGVKTLVNYQNNEVSLLKALLKNKLNIPYSCTNGICGICRAKLLDGQVEMKSNKALDKSDLRRNFILTCQSHQQTNQISLTFDER